MRSKVHFRLVNVKLYKIDQIHRNINNYNIKPIVVISILSYHIHFAIWMLLFYLIFLVKFYMA
jgi:hypothetical protein